MEGERIYGGSNMTVMLKNNNRLPCSPEVLEALWISNPSPSFHGDSYSCSTSTGNSVQHPEEGEDRVRDRMEKKRRLTSDQVRRLEWSFEAEKRPEPERKTELAKELGLQPRQVAIWFQNRRARCKTKQLERDCGSLKASYDRLKDDYDALLKDKEKLKNEVEVLKEKLNLTEKVCTDPELTQPSNSPEVEEFQREIPNSGADPAPTCRHEDASSANSDDVLDSEPSDGGDKLFGGTLLPAQLLFPKLEDACFDDPREEGHNCNWTFSDEGQASWLWHSS